MSTRAWRFANAAPRYDEIDENKFRRALEAALQQVAASPASAGGSGTVAVTTGSGSTLVASGVNFLNFSSDFQAVVTQISPSVTVAVSLVSGQAQVNNGVVAASANGDGTFSVFAFDGRALAGTSVAGPTPVVTPTYGGFIVDMGATPPAGFAWDVEWTNSANGNTGGPFRCTSQRAVFQFFSNNASIPFGTSATTFQFKVSQTGATAAVYGTPSAALAVSTQTVVSALGLVVASQIACVNLAAISADLGVVAAGVIADAIPTGSQTKGIFIKATAFETVVPAGWTTGIFFSGANPVPGTVTGPYVDFTATGTNLWLNGPGGNFTVDASGNVTVAGVVKVKVGPASSALFARVNGTVAQANNVAVTGGSNTTVLTTSAFPGLTTAAQTVRVTVVGRVNISHAPVAGDTLNIRTFIGGTTVGTDDICVSGNFSGTTSGVDAPFTYIAVLSVKGAGTDWIVNQLQFGVNVPAGAQVTLQQTSNKLGTAALPSSGGVVTVKMQSGSNFASATVDSINIEWLQA